MSDCSQNVWGRAGCLESAQKTGPYYHQLGCSSTLRTVAVDREDRQWLLPLCPDGSMAGVGPFPLQSLIFSILQWSLSRDGRPVQLGL